jgi:hypothetical protein
MTAPIENADSTMMTSDNTPTWYICFTSSAISPRCGRLATAVPHMTLARPRLPSWRSVKLPTLRNPPIIAP